MLLLLVCSYVSAQEFVITGTVKEKETHQLLESATIYAETLKDSTLISYTISNAKGFFELELKTKELRVNIVFSYNGFRSVVKELSLKQPKHELGIVFLHPQLQELEGVSVVAERVPIVIKKDTLEFNADSFKTRPDATVEDVLKKLPGVEIDANGKITVNGKEVSEVLVNGQVFFSKDPKVAIKTLPKEIISKIQISDTKTKEEEFTGDQAKGNTKSINLTIKENMNKGLIGRVSAGYGTDDRYQASALVNYFNDKKRFSFLANANNINNTGFSFDEIYEMMGNANGLNWNDGNASFVGGEYGQGIVTSSVLGGSYADAVKDEYEITANFMNSVSDNFNDTKTSRENVLPDGSYYAHSESDFDGSTISNNGNAELEFTINKTLSVSIAPELTIGRTSSVGESSTTSSDDRENLINRAYKREAEEGSNRGFSNRISIFKKLDTLGRNIRLSFSNRNDLSNNEGTFYAKREVFGDNASETVLDQNNFIKNQSDLYSLRLSYREPIIAKKLFLDVGYELNNTTQKNSRDVYDFNEITQAYSMYNTLLSSDFDFKNKQQVSSIGINKNGKKIWCGLGVKYYATNLKNNDFIQDVSFEKAYENFLFNAYSRFTFGKSTRLSLNYNSAINVPAYSQLQPIPNVSNPLNIVTGNPDLKLSTIHGIDLNFSNYNWKDRTGYFIYGSLNMYKDQVTAISTIDEDLIRTTTYDNIDGNYTGYFGARYSKELKKDTLFSARINIKSNVNFNRRTSFSNSRELVSKSLALMPGISTTLNFLDMVEIEPGYGISINRTNYNIDTFNDVSFISHRATLKTTTSWPKHIIWGNDLNYTYNGNVGQGFDKDALFWNMSLGVQLFKEKATLKVLAYDLLDQNNNTRRFTGGDYIQDYQGTVLQRYFMFSMTFKFDQFGGKKERRNRGYYIIN